MSDFAMIAGSDHWLRVSHDNTSVDLLNGIVQLAWQHEDLYEAATEAKTLAGLTFDPWCRIYHSVPEKDHVERLIWANRRKANSAKSLFTKSSKQVGDFTSQVTPTEVNHPTGLVADKKGRLFVSDSANHRVLIFDLTESTLIRTIDISGIPTALCTDGETVFCIVDDAKNGFRILSFSAISMPEELQFESPLASSAKAPSDITIDESGRVFLLYHANSNDAYVYAVDQENQTIEVPFASAIVANSNFEIVVARQPNADFLRFRVTRDSISQLPQLQARHYDGRGIVIDPIGRVAYWSHQGLMNATAAKIKYKNRGRVVCFRLDNNEMQRRWGRIFIDACLPHGTSLKLGFIVSDESVPNQSISAIPPSNVGEFELIRPDLTPPLPSQIAVDSAPFDQSVHKRSQNRELPWSFTDEQWRTFEAPVSAVPGRYLWLIVDLYGKSNVSPKIKNIRIEYPAVDLLRRLPRVFSEQGAASDFLHRYLTILNSDVDELDKRSQQRQILVDPLATPKAMLPWLSDLVGMELDQRWSEAAQREILQQAIWLFKYRGTVAGIKKFIEIYLQRNIILIEHFQVRGLGGAFVGQSDSLAANSILGAGFRIGGKLGLENQTTTVSGINIEDAISTNAHKFSVIVPLILNAEQQSVIEHILTIHRPAHTTFDICSVDSGMRIGTGLHLGLTSVVGQSSGFGQLQIGNSILGQTDVLGQAKSGMTIGLSQTGLDSRVG